MTSVLMTFETPFCVFVREVPLCWACFSEENIEERIMRKECLAPDDFGALCTPEYEPHRRRIEYHPRPGSAGAIGCWSLLSDAGWRGRV